MTADSRGRPFRTGAPAGTGEVVYDVPKDASLDRLELHESLSSPGVRVKVG